MEFKIAEAFASVSFTCGIFPRYVHLYLLCEAVLPPPWGLSTDVSSSAHLT